MIKKQPKYYDKHIFGLNKETVGQNQVTAICEW